MDYQSFSQSLMQDEPPVNISAYLRSLWYDAKGDWERAHVIVQDIDDQKGSLVHAYLHRKEGDIGNADYWYIRAKAARPNISIEQEWEDLVLRFL